MKNKELKILQQVREFHETFGHPIEEKPTTTKDMDLIRLRSNLISEELLELREAMHSEDIVEIADALGDLFYVVAGAAHVFGLGDKMSEVLDRIHASNMSKAFSSVEDAEKFVDENTDEEGPKHYFRDMGNGNIIMYHATGEKKDKIVKGPHYHKPDLNFVKDDAKAEEKEPGNFGGFLVDEKRMEELHKAEAKLNALENAGVDNWQGYEIAMENLEEND